MKKLKGSAGFSLIEVVAATAVIGMLAAMVIPSLDGVYKRAQNAKLANDLAAIDSAIVLYKMDNGTVPAKLADLVDEYLADNEVLEEDSTTYDYDPDEEKGTYILTATDADGEPVTSNGSANSNTNGSTGTTTQG